MSNRGQPSEKQVTLNEPALGQQPPSAVWVLNSAIRTGLTSPPQGERVGRYFL